MPECDKSLTCCDPDIFDYSMVNRPVYTNQEQTIFVPCPDGFVCPGADAEEGGVPGTYVTIPAGFIRLRPTTTQNEEDVQEQIQEEVGEAAQQQAQPALGPRPSVITNSEQSFTAECPEGKYGFPVTRTVGAGTVSAPSVAQANATALGIATSMAESAIQCFDFENTEQTANCPSGFTGDPVTVAAGLYFSNVSQQAADDLAMAAAEAALVCTPTCGQLKIEALTWAHTNAGTGSGTGLTGSLTNPSTSGRSTLTSSQINNNCGSDIVIFVEVDYTLITRVFGAGSGQAYARILRNSTLISEYLFDPACTGTCPCETDIGTLTGLVNIPAGTTTHRVVVEIAQQSDTGGCDDSSASFTLSIS